jgi:hypothetical protein
MEIKISFTNPNINAEGINVYRGVGPLDPTNLPAPLATIPGNSTSFSDTTVEKDGSYNYIFEVFNGTEKVRSGNIAATATFYSGPGNQSLKGGDLSCGYYGLVNSNDFTDWDTVTSWSGLVNATRSNTVVQDWFKFAFKGKILFVPRQPIAVTNWRDLYNLGLVYGVDGIGPREFNTLAGVNQQKFIDIKGSTFKVRLMHGLPDPYDVTKTYSAASNTPAVNSYTGNRITQDSYDSTMDLSGSEWNSLMAKVMTWTAPSQKGENWERFDGEVAWQSDNNSRNGINRDSMMMEMTAANTIISRGSAYSYYSYHPGFIATMGYTTAGYWRPVLEMI